MVAPASNPRSVRTPYNCRGPAGRTAGERPVTTATDIFVNGVLGVFSGIAVLYVLMRVLAAVLGRPAREPTPADPASD